MSHPGECSALDADDTWHPQAAGPIRLHASAAEVAERPRPQESRCEPSTGRSKSDLDDLLPQLLPPVRCAIGYGEAISRTGSWRAPATWKRPLWLEISADGSPVARLDEALAFLYKPPFGASGLSANLMDMEKAELGNYRRLKERGAIGATAMWALQGYSIAKFVRRLLVACLRPVNAES
jgi:hypothetical protein